MEFDVYVNGTCTSTKQARFYVISVPAAYDLQSYAG
jgi:hypothetical protein